MTEDIKKAYGNGVDHVFSQDEMQLMSVDPDWSEETLLAREGIFFLKDVSAKLDLNSNDLKKEARQLEQKGRNSWEEMGIRKTWTHWQVRMTRFAIYYRNHKLPKVHRVEDDWDGNVMLSKKGYFYLTDVCRKIPFSTHQIRYQVRQSKDPQNRYGCWKDEQHNAYLVDMETFAVWMKRIWLKGDFRP